MCSHTLALQMAWFTEPTPDIVTGQLVKMLTSRVASEPVGDPCVYTTIAYF